MEKKGNVSVFALFGLLLLTSVGLFFVLKSESSIVGPVQIDSTERVARYVSNCLDNVALDAAYLAAGQGGYITLPTGHFEHVAQGQDIITAYSFEIDHITLLSLEDIESEIAGFIEEEIVMCTDGFSGFPMQISEGLPSVTVDIQDEEIVVDMHYPLTITTEDSVKTLSDYSSSVPVRLGKLHSIAEAIIAEAAWDTTKGPNLNMLSRLSQDNMRAYYGWTADSLYYVINDYDSSIQKGPVFFEPSVSNRQFLFNFALRYT